MKFYRKYIKDKKVVIFDLDGVILNSKKNMSEAWKYTSKKNKLNNTFENYFQFVGLPFFKILKNMKIENNYSKIKKDFDKGSELNANKISIYPNTITTLNRLKFLGKILVLYTSKDVKRTKLFIKKFKLKFHFVECENKILRGKPYPDQILKILKKLKYKKKEAIFIGDTTYDYLASRNSKIDFIFAKYGYGRIKHKSCSIQRINQLIQ